MLSDISTSLIVTTYNWPEALRIVLLSICDQSVKPSEVIVADDGSGPETEKVIKDVLSSSAYKWNHVWHEDKGVRQSRIKNLAVKYSSGQYLVFIDHDVVLHQDFIADHLTMAENGFFLQGKRSLLPGYYTEKVLERGHFNSPKFWAKGLKNRKNTFHSPFMGRLLSRRKNFETSLRGCNLSMFKSDFLKVDGFDETYDQSWGREDSDLCYRMFHQGIGVKILWFIALQYHLKHRKVENWDRDRLNGELSKTLKEKRGLAKKGYSKLTPEGEVVSSSYDING